jgi:adiponectin receptor
MRHRTPLLRLQDIPPWQQDNPHILTGYRPLSNSYPKSLLSLFYTHNQTANIYTHLLGLIVFALVAHAPYATLPSRYRTATHADVLVFLAYFPSLSACLSLSVAHHAFDNHFRRVYEQWLVCDFLNILCLITGSWVPGVYYGFYCSPGVARFYTVMVSWRRVRANKWSAYYLRGRWRVRRVCARLFASFRAVEHRDGGLSAR